MLIIAQSPENMKGFVFGISFATLGMIKLITFYIISFAFTLCYDVILTAVLMAAFLVYIALSKRYTLRERNREINIQAIIEEHYERYQKQEKEWMKTHHY